MKNEASQLLPDSESKGAYCQHYIGNYDEQPLTLRHRDDSADTRTEAFFTQMKKSMTKKTKKCSQLNLYQI